MTHFLRFFIQNENYTSKPATGHIHAKDENGFQRQNIDT